MAGLYEKPYYALATKLTGPKGEATCLVDLTLAGFYARFGSTTLDEFLLREARAFIEKVGEPFTVGPTTLELVV